MSNTIPERSVDQLRASGLLKWTEIKTESGEPTLGAWVAEMDFGTAPVVAERMKRGIDDGFLGYQPTWVADACADSLARFQARRFGWDFPASDVRIVPSVLHSMTLTIEHLTRPGSAVIVPTPAYMPFLTIPEHLGREVIPVPSRHTPNIGGGEPVSGHAAWSLDLDGIRAGLEAGAGMIILCNPWNPTGRNLRASELAALHDVVSGYDALVFADEIHAPLVFGDPRAFTSYASLGPTYAAHTVTAVAASKAWNIAGLAAAQVILPDAELRERWDREIGSLARGAVPLGLLGAIAAYDDGEAWLDAVLGYISGNLDLLGGMLSGTSIDYGRPEATYLTWWGWEKYLLDEPPSDLLRERARIATNAGSTLGREYAQWSRVNAAMSRPAWEETLERAGGLIARLPLR